MEFDRYLQFIYLLDRLFLIAGIIFLLLGFAGLILTLSSYGEGLYKDDMFILGFGAINGFMSLLGIIFILLHDRIISRPVQTI